MKKIVFIGTGHAMVTQAYNTVLALLDENDDCFLIDAGGGNGIFARLSSCNISVNQIKHFFLTHSHPDHILGAIWLIRKMAGAVDGYKCNFYMSETVYNDLMALCNITIAEPLKRVKNRMNFNIVKHLETFQFGDNEVTFFDTFSKKITQFACKIEASGLKFGFCGDIPLEKENYSLLENADILIHEAFCDSRNAEKMKVYEKWHVTAKDAGAIAKEVSAKKLFLVHKDDEFIETSALSEDASYEFDGDIIVPEDGDIYQL